jgi:hypothetical protein
MNCKKSALFAALLIASALSSLAEIETAAQLESARSNRSSGLSSPFRLPWDTDAAGSFWNWGLVKASPSIGYRLSVADNLPTRGQARADTVLQQLTPSVSFTLGEKWSASYSGSWTWYSTNTMKDSHSDAFNINGHTSFDRLSLSFEQGYDRSNDSRFETASQQLEQNFSTRLSGSYQLSQNSGLQTSVSQDLRFTEGFTTTREWSNSTLYNRRLTDHLSAGLGFSLGYSDTDPGVNSRYHTYRSTFSWSASERLSFSGSLGLNRRRFEAAGSDYRNSTTYSLSSLYRLTGTTTASVTAGRSSGSSYYANTTNTSDYWQVNLSQRVLQRATLSVGFAENRANYSTLSNTSIRRDKTSSFNASLSTSFGEKLSLSLFYRSSKNNTNAQGFGIDSSQYGFSVRYKF